jgi:hypothetical protein
MMGGFPDRVRVKLRYVEALSLASTTGAFNYYEFNGNSVFDPNKTGTGGQPANYDDFAAQYNRYRVLGSTAIVNTHALTVGGTTEMMMGLYPYNGTAAANTIVDSVAQPYSLFWRVTNTPTNVVHSMTTAKMVGQDPHTADRLQAQYSASPSDVWIWRIFYQAEDGASTATTVAYMILDYDVEFFDRIAANLDVRLARLQELKEIRHRRLEDRKNQDKPAGWTDLGDARAEDGKWAYSSTEGTTGGMLEGTSALWASPAKQPVKAPIACAADTLGKTVRGGTLKSQSVK